MMKLLMLESSHSYTLAGKTTQLVFVEDFITVVKCHKKFHWKFRVSEIETDDPGLIGKANMWGEVYNNLYKDCVRER